MNSFNPKIATSIFLTLVFLGVNYAIAEEHGASECHNTDGTANSKTAACLGVDLLSAEYFDNLNITSEEQIIEFNETIEFAPYVSKNAVATNEQLDKKSIKSDGTNPTAFIDSNLRWRNGQNGAKIYDGVLHIPVCWINPSATVIDRAGRELTQAAIENTWNSQGIIKFEGWKKCPADKKNIIRIKIEDSHPRAVTGNIAGNVEIGMWLNFQFNSFSPLCRTEIGTVAEADGYITWSNCVHSIGVHEFGHTLGYYHEHDRLFFDNDDLSKLGDDGLSRAREACDSLKVTKSQARDRSAANIIKTEYDFVSVMNYCFNIYDHKASLSKLDMKGLSLAYGVK